MRCYSSKYKRCGKRIWFLFFFFLLHLAHQKRKYLFKQSQPPPTITDRVVVRATRQRSATEPGYSQRSSAMLCTWSRCDLPLRRVPVLPPPSVCPRIGRGGIQQHGEMNRPAPAALTRWFWVTLTKSTGEQLPCPVHLMVNSCLKLTFQESIWKLRSCSTHAPSDAFCPQAEQGSYPDQCAQFSRTSHLSPTLLGGTETAAKKQEHSILHL